MLQRPYQLLVYKGQQSVCHSAYLAALHLTTVMSFLRSEVADCANPLSAEEPNCAPVKVELLLSSWHSRLEMGVYRLGVHTVYLFLWFCYLRCGCNMAPVISFEISSEK